MSLRGAGIPGRTSYCKKSTAVRIPEAYSPSKDRIRRVETDSLGEVRLPADAYYVVPMYSSSTRVFEELYQKNAV